MNDVIVSATLKGSFQEISNDGVQFVLVTRGGRQNSSMDEYTVLAYGNSAKFLQQHARSGDRVVVQGRLSSEKLDSDVYHTAVTVNRVLSVSPAQNGIDYSKATVSGLATCEGVRSVGESGKKLASFNIANSRKYVTRDGDERSYTTYLGATIWGERAEALEEQGLIPTEGREITIEGILKPRTYQNKDGQSVSKIDIWVDDIIFSEAHSSPEPKRRTNSDEQEVPVRETRQEQRKTAVKTVDTSPW
jgi:single stranded DNA-binding protein